MWEFTKIRNSAHFSPRAGNVDYSIRFSWGQRGQISSPELPWAPLSPPELPNLLGNVTFGALGRPDRPRVKSRKS